MEDFHPDCVKSWASAYPLPTSYVALDVETTGLDFNRDLVVQIGFCVVKDRVSVANAAFVIDQFRDKPDHEKEMIRGRLRATKAAMDVKNVSYPWTEEVLSRGVPPAVAVRKIVEACETSDYCLAHYGLKFDYPMIERLLSSYSDFRLPSASSGRLLDSALMFRAARLGMCPAKDEPVERFMERVAGVKARGKFSLSTCLEFFSLEKQGAEREHAHDAAYDAWLSHLVFERLREIANTPVG